MIDWNRYLPPEPTKPVADDLQAKVVKFLQLKSEGKSLNDQIRSNKQTRNPDILDKLVEHFGIKEIDSNYPKDIFDPFAFSPSDFYDHIGSIIILYLLYDLPNNRNSCWATTNGGKETRG